MIIFSVTFVTFSYGIEEIDLVVLNHLFVWNPKQSICPTVVEPWIFIWRRPLWNEKCDLLFRICNYILRIINTSRRRIKFVRHHFFSILSGNAKCVIWWEMISSTFSCMLSNCMQSCMLRLMRWSDRLLGRKLAIFYRLRLINLGAICGHRTI